MVRVFNYDIVFAEITNEVTLALSITGCPNRCPGCHSPHLQQNIGEDLTEEVLDSLMSRYGTSITCLCFMGGDGCPHGINQLAGHVKSRYKVKVAWYSGNPQVHNSVDIDNFDYIKLGPYIQSLGPVSCKDSNQKLYQVVNGELKELTSIKK